MNKNRIITPVPSEGARVFALIQIMGEEVIRRMAAKLKAHLGESITNTRAIWIVVCIISLSLLMVFLTTDSVVGIGVMLALTVVSAKRGKLFYEDAHTHQN